MTHNPDTVEGLMEEMGDAVDRMGGQWSVSETCDHLLRIFGRARLRMDGVESFGEKRSFAHVMLAVFCELIRRDESLQQNQPSVYRPQYAAGGRAFDQNLFLWFATDNHTWPAVLRHLRIAIEYGLVERSGLDPLKRLIEERSRLPPRWSQPPGHAAHSMRPTLPWYPFLRAFLNL